MVFSDEKKKVSVELKSQYGKGKTANIALGAQVAQQEFALQLSANAPQAEKFKKLNLQIVSKVIFKHEKFHNSITPF